jgi:hypothetical protein
MGPIGHATQCPIFGQSTVVTTLKFFHYLIKSSSILSYWKIFTKQGHSTKIWGFHGSDYRMPSSVMWHHVALIRTDITEKCTASIVRVKRITELETLAVTSNWSTLRRRTSDGGDRLLQNIGSYRSHTALHPRRLHSYKVILTLRLQIPAVSCNLLSFDLNAILICFWFSKFYVRARVCVWGGKGLSPPTVLHTLTS